MLSCSNAEMFSELFGEKRVQLLFCFQSPENTPNTGDNFKWHFKVYGIDITEKVPTLFQKMGAAP